MKMGEFLHGTFTLKIKEVRNTGIDTDRYIATDVHTKRELSVKFRNHGNPPETYIGMTSCQNSPFCDTFYPMIIFLIAGMPLFFIMILNVFFSGSFYGRELVMPLGCGVLWFFPCCFIYVLFSDLIPVVYDGKEFYFSRVGIDIGFPFLFCLITGLFTCRRKQAGGKELFLHLAAFFTGFFMLFAQYVLILFPAWYAEYIYFLLPLLWMSITVFASLLLPLFFGGSGILRILFPVILAALPFAMGAVPVLYAMNYRPFAWLLTLVFFASSLVCLWRIPLKA
jgi:hypothetical protein